MSKLVAVERAWRYAYGMTNNEFEDAMIEAADKASEQTVKDILDTLNEFLKDGTTPAERAGMLRAIAIIKANH